MIFVTLLRFATDPIFVGVFSVGSQLMILGKGSTCDCRGLSSWVRIARIDCGAKSGGSLLAANRRSAAS